MAYLYLAKQLGIAVVFAVWAYIVARGLFARASLRLSPLEEVALLVPAGLAVGIALLFVLGLAGALTAPGILAGGGLALVLAGWRLRGRLAWKQPEAMRAKADRETLARLVMVLILGTVLVPVALDALTPPFLSDEVRYHLPYALHFAEQGRIVPDMDLRYPFHALNLNLLYTAALIFGDDVTPHYIHLLFGCLAGLALYVLAVPGCGRLVAFCAVVLFVVTPTFRTFAPVTYVDFGLAAFVTSTIACLDRARGRAPLVVCAGLAFGAALGTKYLALAFLPLVVAWSAYRTRACRKVIWFVVVAVLTGAPWYVYNLVWTGNPVSPFAGEWFGSWPWTAEDLVAQNSELTREARVHTVTDLLLLPYHLVFESHRFRVQSSVSAPMAFGLVALVLLPWWSPKMRPYGLLVLVAVVAWFFTVSILRYLAAILPIWCLVSAWSVERTVWFAGSLVTRRRTISEVARRRASYAAAAIVLVFAEYHFWRDDRWPDAAAVTERVVHRDRFLRTRIPMYGVVEYLRRAGIRDEVIFAFPPGALLSYARGNRVVGDLYGPMGPQQNRFNVLCPQRSLDAFRRRGISLLVLGPSSLERYLASRLPPEYTDRDATVFRIGSRLQTPARHSRFTVGDDSSRVVPHFLVASDGLPTGVVRIVNHSDEAGTVVIYGIDDTGTRYGPAALDLGPRETVRFNSENWVACGFARRASGGPGGSESADRWLSLATGLDVEALAYVRSDDGFLAPMHEVARTTVGTGGEIVHHVPFFGSADERSQVSHLRLVNPGHRDADVTIAGRDDAGERAIDEVRVSLPAGTACRLSARALESGSSDDESGCDIVSGRLGDGQGRWRLAAAATGGEVQVMSLLMDAAGNLANLSASAGARSGTSSLPLFFPVSASGEDPQGVARIINHSNAAGTVEIRGIDDAGTPHGPVTLAIDGQQAVHLDAVDMESGNASKGLPEGLGDGEGDWRLSLATELEVEALAYARTGDGFVTSMHGVAKSTRGANGEMVHYVPFFNPGRNTRQVSRLRLSNSGDREAEVTIEGRDAAGMEAPWGVVHLTLPAREACMLSARALESGEPELDSDTCTGERFAFDGALGEGVGKWSLFVIAEDGDVQVMSLLKSPTGHLANLSSTNRTPAGRPVHGRRFEQLPEVTIAQVERWGPRSSGVGEPFNLQPNGHSALWFLVRELDPYADYRIHIGPRPILTTVDVERSLITAGLTPRHSGQLVSKEGETPIYLVDPTRGKQLMGHFHVHPQ